MTVYSVLSATRENVLLRGSTPSESSSRTKSPQPLAPPGPEHPVKVKSWALSGDVSWVMVSDVWRLVNVQETCSPASTVTTKRVRSSRASPLEHQIATRPQPSSWSWVTV